MFSQRPDLFRETRFNKETPHDDFTHPPTGPVEGTLEHRPQLAVDTEAFLMNNYVPNTTIEQHREGLEADDGVWKWNWRPEPLNMSDFCRPAQQTVVFISFTDYVSYWCRDIVMLQSFQLKPSPKIFSMCACLLSLLRWFWETGVGGVTESRAWEQQEVGCGAAGGPPTSTPLTGGSDSAGPGWCAALSTYLVCWANPGTLVKMFMSALRGNKKAP